MKLNDVGSSRSGKWQFAFGAPALILMLLVSISAEASLVFEFKDLLPGKDKVDPELSDGVPPPWLRMAFAQIDEHLVQLTVSTLATPNDWKIRELDFNYTGGNVGALQIYETAQLGPRVTSPEKADGYPVFFDIGLHFGESDTSDFIRGNTERTFFIQSSDQPLFTGDFFKQIGSVNLVAAAHLQGLANDQSTWIGSNGEYQVPPIPEPSTFFAGALACALLGYDTLRRRSRRQSQ